jgi:GNAT superfamily N-acetyltransferase
MAPNPLFSKSRQRLPVPVLQVEEPVCAATRKVAERFAREVQLPPTMARVPKAADGRFVLPAILLASTAVGDPEPYLYEEIADFGMRVVTDANQRSALAAAFAPTETSGQWNVARWIAETGESGSTLLVVDKPGTDEPGGFLIYKRFASIDTYEDPELRLDYGIHPEYLYVVPECRGQSLSSALRRAALIDVVSDVDALADLFRSGRLDEIDELDIDIRVRAEPHSDEGERFAEAMHENLSTFVAQAFTGPERDRLFKYGVGLSLE